MTATRAGVMLVAAFAALTGLVACGGREESERPAPATTVPNRPLDAYAQQGLITGPDAFPAVGGFATLAGPADSSWVLFGLSLPPAALRFHRDGDGFTAGYTVDLRFRRDGSERARSHHTGRVRIATYEETGRTEPSILYQDRVLLGPGTYIVDVSVLDSIGTDGFTATDTLVLAPSPAASLVLVHEAQPRASVSDPPLLLMNARRSAALGREAPRVHIEAYDSTAGPALLIVRDAEGADVFALAVPLHATDSSATLRSATIDLPLDSLPIGVFSLRLDHGARVIESPHRLLVTISSQWMVANYEEVLDYLVYIASEDEIERLRDASTAAERRVAWDEFWRQRDPVPASAVNEYRDAFFERVRVAAEQFAEPGRAGWRTDRGRVFIVLGPPDRVHRGELEARPSYDTVEWIYARGRGRRAGLLFVDRTGFGRFELTPDSELEFRVMADRLRSDR